jgi:2-isopropylmalate synthase
MKTTPGVEIFDTTLRDGAQGEDVSFSVDDKLAIAETLDLAGVHYIEGGYPAPNRSTDLEFFRRAKKHKWRHAQLVAFGSTHRHGLKPEADPALQALFEAGTATVCFFGKTWDLHVQRVLGIGLPDNLKLIQNTTEFFRKHKRRVIYDAEHFFDAYATHPEYALECLKAAVRGGAECVVLCDTIGSRLPHEIFTVTQAVVKALPGTRVGIHSHDDSGVAVANTLEAVRAGARQVQGTVNGLGERCGNANLISIIPALRYKMGIHCMPDERIDKLTLLARTVASIANVSLNEHQPYVGLSAFAHKSGTHADAVAKDSRSYEHMQPEKVGNQRRILISDQAGRSSVIQKAAQFGVRLDKGSPHTKSIIERVKELEHQGYQFEGADASFFLLLKKAMGAYQPCFELKHYNVAVKRFGLSTEAIMCEATVKVAVEGVVRHTASEGHGPVNALDNALRQALEGFYPCLKGTRLVDYKVRVLMGRDGTASKVRVLMETSDGRENWFTVGVHENILEASWEALADSLEYKLMQTGKGCRRIRKAGA